MAFTGSLLFMRRLLGVGTLAFVVLGCGSDSDSDHKDDPCTRDSCHWSKEFCSESVNDFNDIYSYHSCQPLPESCVTDATCECLAKEFDNSVSSCSTDGPALILHHPGG